jgi:hypothetical protein
MAKKKLFQSTTFNRKEAIIAHKQKKLIKAQYSKKKWGMDLSLEDLALVSATYPSGQQYGPKFEKWMNYNLNWDNVKSSLGRGDSKIKGKEIYVEQKWNIRTDVGPGGMQHRFWQPIQYYLYGHVDDSDSENITVDIYLLTKEQAIEEKELLNATPTHGTKDANASNDNIEYSMGVKYGSLDHQRWKNKYRITLEELKKYDF